MIYSNYNESAVDYLANAKSHGITIPATTTCMEQNMFINGIAEAAMLNAFEKIGESEKAYYESGVQIVNESVFDSIREAFEKIAEAIKKAFEKVIAWFAEKQSEVAKKMREKEVERYFNKINEIKNKTDGVDKSHKLCKSIMWGEKATGEVYDLNTIVKDSKTQAHDAAIFAKKVIDASVSYEDANSLKVAAAKEILGDKITGSSLDECIKNYRKYYIAESESDVTVGDALADEKLLKETVLAGKQKYYIKKCYTDEKATINSAISYLKKWADKDDKTVKSRVARAKDVITVMDAVYRMDMDIIKIQYSEARKVLFSLAKYAGSVTSKRADAEKLSKKNESANDFYMW